MRTTNSKNTLKHFFLAIAGCLLLTSAANANLTGDEIQGGAFSMEGMGDIFGGVNDVGPNVEFINENFHGLSYQMDVDGAPYNRVKIWIDNPNGAADRMTMDTLWYVADLDCISGDGGSTEIEVTALIPILGNSINVTQAMPFLGDGLQIQTAPGQVIPGGGSICAEFAIVTANDIPGDVNGDGAVNLLDVDNFVFQVAFGLYSVGADVNRDGVVNLLDIDPFIAALAGG